MLEFIARYPSISDSEMKFRGFIEKTVTSNLGSIQVYLNRECNFVKTIK